MGENSPNPVTLVQGPKTRKALIKRPNYKKILGRLMVMELIFYTW
jgi:hypothetical protein